jgi:predicted PurR-regulated permease PerM
MPLNVVLISYLLSALAVPLVLHYHLLPTVFAGLAVHVLTAKLARRLPSHIGRVAHAVALTAIVAAVITLLAAALFGLWTFLDLSHGMAALFSRGAEVLDNLKRSLPPSLAESVPANIQDMREEVTELLREHGKNLSTVGISGVKFFIHALFGMVIGGMTAMHRLEKNENWPPLCGALHDRSSCLAEAFDKVVFAQVKISAFNTFLTALYLLVILPLGGVHLPLVSVLIPFTFITGLLPVVGNLISNTVIVLISLGSSPLVAVASLVFLVLVHKLEYFANARIVGGEVHAKAWELLCAMLLFEAVFGIAGMVAAPVIYGWLKAELKAAKMI